jgi:thiol-disulfide isomerase/thioredoxin
VPDTAKGNSTAKDAFVFPLTKEPMYLPPGSYRFRPGAESADAKEDWLDIPSVPGVFHTPKFVLTAKKVVTMAGKPAPELSVVGALNIGSKVKLSDFKGKWVLIDFWGTWCSPCRSGMPRLMDFYTKNKAKRSQFEILSIHDSSHKTVAAMKAEIAKIVKGQWKGKALPFPVLLDQGGKTVAAYGITAFPTEVLIDPQGRIVEGGDLEMLKKKLAG